jgi:hypothetical protein
MEQELPDEVEELVEMLELRKQAIVDNWPTGERLDLAVAAIDKVIARLVAS